MALGFYGKLPSQGDFVTRRLPWVFTEPWDAWLQKGLKYSREQLGDTWLDHYLSAPVWRFRLAPGLAGPTVWAGLWFASVDRVGRHFPLCFARAIPGADSAAAAAGLIGPGEDELWPSLEDLALMALDPRISVSQLEQLSLAWEIPPLPSSTEPVFSHPVGLRALDVNTSADEARRLCHQLSSSSALFFTWGSETLPPLILTASDWPDVGHFPTLLGSVPGLPHPITSAAEPSTAPPDESAQAETTEAVADVKRGNERVLLEIPVRHLPPDSPKDDSA